MRLRRVLSMAVCTAGIAFATGCADHQWSTNPPPPPPAPQYSEQAPAQPAYQPAPAYNPGPGVQFADRNGFMSGRADGGRDAYSGIPYRARSTRAYYQTPGFDPRFGPYPEYQNAYRLAYLRGYDQGYGQRPY